MANRAPDLDDGHLYLPSDIFPDEDDIDGHHEGSNVGVTDDVTCSSKLAAKPASLYFFNSRQNLTSPPPTTANNKSPAFSSRRSDGRMLHRGISGMEGHDGHIPSGYPFGVSRMRATQFVANGVRRFRGRRGSGGTGVFLPRVARNDPTMYFAGQKNSGQQEQQQYNGPVNGRGAGGEGRRMQGLPHQPPPYWTW